MFFVFIFVSEDSELVPSWSPLQQPPPPPSSTDIMSTWSSNNNGTDSKRAVSEFYESSSRFESKQSTYMSSSSTINGGDAGRRPEYKVDAYSLQSEKQSRRVGDNAPVQVRHGPRAFYCGSY